MFHQRVRRSFSSLLAGPAVAASSLAAASSAARLETSEEPQPAATSASTGGLGVEFVGVFVDKESAAKLRAQYPSKFLLTGSSDTASENQLFLVLKYNPTDKEKDTFAPILGRATQLHVKGYVEDAHTQAVLVAVTTESGEPIDFDAGTDFPHVTVASANGQQGLNSGYTSVLLERLRASGQLDVLLAKGDVEWSGELPAFESTLLPLFNPFPTVPARITPPPTQEENVLTGTLCVSSSFDPESGECLAPKAECGFCKFMKAGPCGAQFTAWEACLDRCKKSGLDFIDNCGVETLALRDCVDANPEYYSVLNDPPEGEEDKEEEDKKTEDKTEEKEEAK